MPTEYPNDRLSLADAHRAIRNATGKNINRSTVYRWCLKGALPAERIGSRIIVRRRDVEAFLERQPVGVPERDAKSEKRGKAAADRILLRGISRKGYRAHVGQNLRRPVGHPDGI